MADLRIQTARVFKPLLKPARYKGAYGGRGSAKSWFFARQLIRAHVVDPETRSVCIREVQLSLKESVKRLLEDQIQALGVGAYFDVGEKFIRTGKDGLILFQGMQNHTAESIKSLEGYKRAWVEEAQSLSQRSLMLLRPTMRLEGSELWFSWNPRRSDDPVDEFFRGPDAVTDDAIVVRASYRDNPWFPDVLRKDMKRDQARDPDTYAHVWMGEYETHSEARVFKNWRVETFETAPRAQFYFGADWGFSIDPTVMVRCYIEGRTLYVDREVYRVGCEIDHTPAIFDTLDPERHAIARQWPVIADSARPETISYMQRHGYPQMRPAKKGAGSVEDGVKFLQSYDIVVHSRCVHTIRELTHYSYEKDRLTDKVLPILEDKKNHVIDALRYALESVRMRTGSAFMDVPGL